MLLHKRTRQIVLRFSECRNLGFHNSISISISIGAYDSNEFYPIRVCNVPHEPIFSLGLAIWQRNKKSLVNILIPDRNQFIFISSQGNYSSTENTSAVDGNKNYCNTIIFDYFCVGFVVRKVKRKFVSVGSPMNQRPNLMLSG